MNLSDAAKDLYEKKYLYPESRLAQRCLDYKANVKAVGEFGRFELRRITMDSFPF